MRSKNQRVTGVSLKRIVSLRELQCKMQIHPQIKMKRKD